IASGRFSTRWATWSSVELREKQVGVVILGLLFGGSGGVGSDFTVARRLFALCPGFDELAHPHPQQADAPREIDPLEAQAGLSAHCGCVGGELLDGGVPRDALEVVIAQLDADGLADVTFALQVCG